ncbi:MAG: sigma-70 family RNA polymerase sigma factor [Deltaproteobacteria bacterium]|nr:sigma-70 family RNA polymerase sigma factor [Deltaproteobacteria bacterium]
MGRPRGPAFEETPRAMRRGFEQLHEWWGSIVGAVLHAAGRRGAWPSADDLLDILSELQLRLLKEPTLAESLRQGPRERSEAEIARLAARVTRDVLRARTRARSVDPVVLAALGPNDPGPEVAIEREEDSRELWKTVERLSAREQELVELFYVAARSPKEIAAEMGITVSTVFSKRTKLEAKLRRFTEEDGRARKVD